MVSRILSTTISGKPKWFIELKRKNKWVKVKSYGSVKSFDSEQHAQNYLRKVLDKSSPKKDKQLNLFAI